MMLEKLIAWVKEDIRSAEWMRDSIDPEGDLEAYVAEDLHVLRMTQVLAILGAVAVNAGECVLDDGEDE